jgi:hypothetical protein
MLEHPFQYKIIISDTFLKVLPYRYSQHCYRDQESQQTFCDGAGGRTTMQSLQQNIPLGTPMQRYSSTRLGNSPKSIND